MRGARASLARPRTRALRAAAFLVLLGAAAWLALLRVVPKPLLVNRPGFSQQVLARDRSLLRLTLTSDERYRLFVPLEEIPEPLVAATLLQEDRYFFRHPGINPFALLRGLRETYLEGDRRVGGSTLSMQVARLRFGLVTRTPRGKWQQILRALQLELFYTKREILEAYLNLAPYGANVEGVGAASFVWFGKPVHEIDLAEALTLAVLPKSPAARSPHSEHGRRTLAAASRALHERWREAHGSDVAAQLDAILPRAREDLPYLAPHLADRVVAEHPFDRTLATTLDPRLQRLVERQVALHVARAGRFGIHNAAVLVVDHRSMDAVAYVGSARHSERAIQGAVDGIRGRRSPGSALKPFLYALAIDAGLIHPHTLLRDASLTLSAWNPENFERDFLGPISATDALVRSRNLPAVQLAMELPAPGLHGLLARAGIQRLRSWEYYGLALTLGGAEVRLDELVSLYAMLANGGVLRPIVLLRREADEISPEESPRLVSAEASHLVLEMLRTNPSPRQAAVRAVDTRWSRGLPWKTGTSWGFRDAWALGIVGPYVVGVWVGNFDGTPNPAFVGRQAAGPLLFGIADALRATSKGLLESPPPGELSLVRTRVCALSGGVPRASCPSRKTTWVIPGVSPIAPCSIHREIALEVASGLRACPGTTAGVRRAVYEFWPSDLLALFRSAGIARRTPPPFAPACRSAPGFALGTLGGAPLRIESPQTHVVYQLGPGGSAQIPLNAVSDADGRSVDWFVNDAWVGRAASGSTLFWRARPGRFSVRAVDDLGRAETRRIEVSGAH